MEIKSHAVAAADQSADRAKATSLALAATTVLTAAKIAVAVVTGSVGILSEAIHSALDLLSSLITFFVVRASARPADWDHPYGHGKMESLSALFEAFLLLVAGGYIVYESLSALTAPGRHVEYIGWGLVVTGASVVINLYVYFQNRKVAHDQESIAIETNAYHFLTDVFSSLAVFLTLGVMQYTNWTWLDPAVALLIAAYVTWVGVDQIKKCLAELSDTALPAQEVAQVRAVLRTYEGEFLNYHDLKTRKVGAVRHVDLHLTMCSEQKVRDAHDVCDRIEDEIGKNFKEVQVNIHVEPCGTHEASCTHVCEFKKR